MILPRHEIILNLRCFQLLEQIGVTINCLLVDQYLIFYTDFIKDIKIIDIWNFQKKIFKSLRHKNQQKLKPCQCIYKLLKYYIYLRQYWYHEIYAFFLRKESNWILGDEFYSISNIETSCFFYYTWNYSYGGKVMQLIALWISQYPQDKLGPIALVGNQSRWKKCLNSK